MFLVSMNCWVIISGVSCYPEISLVVPGVSCFNELMGDDVRCFLLP